MSSTNVDWKEIAMALAQRINFAMQHCQCKGGGILNTETQSITHWRDYMAAGIEMIPGVKIDREIMATLDLPPAKRKKAQAQIIKERADKLLQQSTEGAQ